MQVSLSQNISKTHFSLKVSQVVNARRPHIADSLALEGCKEKTQNAFMKWLSWFWSLMLSLFCCGFSRKFFDCSKLRNIKGIKEVFWEDSDYLVLQYKDKMNGLIFEDRGQGEYFVQGFKCLDKEIAKAVLNELHSNADYKFITDDALIKKIPGYEIEYQTPTMLEIIKNNKRYRVTFDCKKTGVFTVAFNKKLPSALAFAIKKQLLSQKHRSFSIEDKSMSWPFYDVKEKSGRRIFYVLTNPFGEKKQAISLHLLKIETKDLGLCLPKFLEIFTDRKTQTALLEFAVKNKYKWDVYIQVKEKNKFKSKGFKLTKHKLTNYYKVTK